MSEIYPQVSAVENRVSDLESSLSRLSRRVDGLEHSVMDAISELQQTMDTFVTEYRRDRTVQNAYNEITEAKSELEQSFGRYKEVRELAADIIYIVDSGFIRRSVIVDVTERLAIKTPQYWLAPAVLAVAAWLKDDEGLYLDSISSALTLDPGKTALFMMLLLRHQERAGAMREWIGRYLAGLEPTNLPTDFAVILEAISGGTLAPGSAPQLARRMQEWYKNASSSRDVEAGEIGQWEQNLLTLAAAGNYEEEFPVLARSSPTWELLRKRHEANTAIEAADQYFRNRFGDGAEVPADLDGRISNLLKHLAGDPDAEEEQILRKIRRAEAVIDTRDDAVAQRRVAADEADRSRALNILSLVTRAAFPGGRRQAPTMTELLAIMLSKRFISEAAENTQNKHQRFDSVQITLGKRRGTYSCATAAEVTPDALRRQAEDAAEELAGEIDYEVSQRGKRLRRRASGWLVTAGAVSCGLLAAAFSGPVTSSRAIFFQVLAFVALGSGVLNRFPLLRRRLRSITDGGQQEKSSIERTLHQVSNEMAGLFSQERRSRDLLPELQDYLLRLSADDVARAARLAVQPPQILALPGPLDDEMPDDVHSDEGNEEKYARGFPEWTPQPPAGTR